MSDAAPQSQKGPSHQQQKACILFAVWFRKGRGAERYREYLEAASPIAEKYGARRIEFMVPIEVLRGDFNPDYLSVVEWPSIDHYYRFLEDVHYRAVAALREEAVAKSVALYCRRG